MIVIVAMLYTLWSVASLVVMEALNTYCTTIAVALQVAAAEVKIALQ